MGGSLSHGLRNACRSQVNRFIRPTEKGANDQRDAGKRLGKSVWRSLKGKFQPLHNQAKMPTDFAQGATDLNPGFLYQGFLEPLRSKFADNVIKRPPRCLADPPTR
jgi:hypothetical protein